VRLSGKTQVDGDRSGRQLGAAKISKTHQPSKTGMSRIDLRP
jgi:hypothetical protein